MKYNLKKRPHIDYRGVDSATEELLWNLEDWFKGFEKELRKFLSDYLSKYTIDPDDALYCFIKEILGEEVKP